MGTTVQEKKFNAWKHGLLDISKRNKMMNYRKTKRTTLDISVPDIASLYQRIAVNEETISFKKRVDTSYDTKLTELFYLMDKVSAPVELATGEISSPLPIDEMNRTVKQLRAKAKLSQEEKGINILYLSFGFLEWRQKANDTPLLSPLVLVPVSIELASITSPYTLSRLDEDTVINPTLEYALASDFGIQLPEFDGTSDDIQTYLKEVDSIVKPSGWRVVHEVNLGLLSFLKIVMYKDLEKYRDCIFENPVIKAFCGDPSELPQVEDAWINYNHDLIPCNETWQVVNADASQQDAILLAKKGVSFVLQGPPGTGKSQTITNIIAESLADGKKVLFVSEKMAALSVVYRRLKDVGLASYCLSLHNYKAEKRGVIQDLVNSLDAPVKNLRPGVSDFLRSLEKDRSDLNTYFKELYEVRKPLNITIYDAITDLVMLENVPLYKLSEDLSTISETVYKNRLSALKKLKEFKENYQGNIEENPWRNTSIPMVTYDVQNDIVETLNHLEPALFGASALLSYFNSEFNYNHEWTWNDFTDLCGILESFFLFIRVRDQIESHYDNTFLEPFDIGKATDLLEELGRLEALASEYRLLTADGNSADKRNFEKDKYRSTLEYTRNVQKWMSGFNQTFGTSYDWTNNNFEVIQHILKAGLDVDEFEPFWLTEPTSIDSCNKICKCAIDQLYNIEVARTDLLKYQAEVIMDSLLPQNIKNLNGSWDYYAEISGDIHSLRDQLKSAESKLESMHIEEHIYQTRWFRIRTIEDCQDRIKKLNAAISFVDSFNRTTAMSLGYTVKDLDQVKSLFKALNAPIDYSTSWFVNQQVGTIKIIAESRQQLISRIFELKSQIDKEWSSDFYNINATEMLGKFRTDYKSFFKRLGGAYKQDKRIISGCKINQTEKLSDDYCITALEILQQYQSVFNEFNETESDVKNQLGKYYNGYQTDWSLLQQALNAAAECENYINIYGIEDRILLLFSLEHLSRRAIRIGENSIAEWLESHDLDYLTDNVCFTGTAIFTKLLTETTTKLDALETAERTVSTIEKFVSKDFKAITGDATIKIRDNISIRELNNCLSKYERVLDEISAYISENENRERKLPNLFTGNNTDWDHIMKLAQRTKNMVVLLNSECNIKAVIDWISVSKELRVHKNIGGLTVAEAISDNFTNTARDIFSVYGTNLQSVEKDLQGKLSMLQMIDDYCDKVFSFVSDKSSLASLDEIRKLFQRYIEIKAVLKTNTSSFQNIFENKNIQFECASVQEQLFELFEDYLNLQLIETKHNELWSSFVDGDPGFAETLSSAMQACRKHKPDDSLLIHFNNWFNTDETAHPINAIAEKITGCKDLEYLYSWLNYSDVLALCDKEGLRDYINYVNKATIKEKQLVSCYKKGFLTKWLQDLLVRENITYLLRFQSYLHETTIRNFRENDAKQLKLAQGRLAEKLSQDKPSGVNHLANAMDDISILRRESEKKRRIMPLRKLFKVIPTLLQKIKPCFMMSPLSVSYFLDSDMYQFDTVIFDEASQILPEDAIGAIYRGKQVIIAGDTKQMPPTNFFTATSKNDEYDTEYDDEDSYLSEIVNDSILDEANTYLPSCTLLWHYRSKDESLIAFSNKEIYSNRLVTFPNCNRGADRGLEYVYVPNGCYHERGNIMEARKCVQLVAEHIRNHPNRSLGIIAFSEKQQSVIEDAINEFRLKNPSFENFFDEENEEPFFVKNLENVQGDERDTIIFSICYAKNKQGRMYMRFGPLGLAGGERRLNVAITRAKYNVKLVGSIMPGDITISNTTKEGVKLLRDYIYYAMKNDYGMPLGSDTAATDEFFVDMIADYLYENGYKVRRNVGESEFKVDIAVIHPDSEDEYFAGIECDGHNYTMARTARDRDVLSEDIMHSMGWELHHVWSFNWFKNPIQEKERLLKFLKEASKKFIEKKSSITDPVTMDISDLFDDMDIENITLERDTSTEVHKIEFAEYIESEPWKKTFPRSFYSYDNLSVRIQYVMEIEAPIHKEMLYKRLAYFYGKQKATAPIRYSIDDCIRKMLGSSITQKGDFLYFNKMTEIKARKPAKDQTPRNIEYICPEEIQDGIITVLRLAYSMTPDELTGEVARAFGFARTGAKIKRIIQDNYRALIDKEVLKESNGKAYLKDG